MLKTKLNNGYTLELIVSIFMGVFFVCVFVPPKLQAGQNWAVIIAVDEYKNDRLNYAVKQGKKLGGVLESSYDFADVMIRVKENASMRNIGRFFRYELRKIIAPDDSLFIYISGHGIYEDKHLYFVPYGGEPNASQGIAFKYFLQLFKKGKYNKHIPAKHVFFVLDFCYSGQAIDELMEFREKIDNNRSISVLSAVVGKKKAVDPSPVTDCFIKELENKRGLMAGHFSMESFKKRIINNKLNTAQKPDFYTIGNGQFSFNPRQVLSDVEDTVPQDAFLTQRQKTVIAFSTALLIGVVAKHEYNISKNLVERNQNLIHRYGITTSESEKSSIRSEYSDNKDKILKHENNYNAAFVLSSIAAGYGIYQLLWNSDNQTPHVLAKQQPQIHLLSNYNINAIGLDIRWSW